jgi:S-adenosyl methyltransferase
VTRLWHVANTATVRADLRQPAEITARPGVNRLIDWSRPVAVLLVAILHFIPDGADPAGIAGQFREVMAPGSHLVISHAHHHGDDNAVGHLHLPALAVHALLGTLLLATSIAVIARAALARKTACTVIGAIAFLAIVAAWVSGARFVGDTSSSASFAMAVATAVALLGYMTILLISGQTGGPAR